MFMLPILGEPTEELPEHSVSSAPGSAELVEVETSDTLSENQDLAAKNKNLDDVLEVARQILNLDVSLLRAPSSFQIYKQRLQDLMLLIQRLSNDCPSKQSQADEVIRLLEQAQHQLDSLDRSGDDTARDLELQMLRYMMTGINQETSDAAEGVSGPQTMLAPIVRPTIAEPWQNLCALAKSLLQRSSTDKVSSVEYLHLLRLLMEKIIFLQRSVDEQLDHSAAVKEQTQLRSLFQLLQEQAGHLFPKDSQVQAMLDDTESSLQMLAAATEQRAPKPRRSKPKLTRVSVQRYEIIIIIASISLLLFTNITILVNQINICRIF